MDQKNMDLFWRFVYERQAIWHRRFRLRQPAPWTKDSVLRAYKFTNVYRELDKGTVFYLTEVVALEGGRLSAREYIFKTLLYRIFNHIPTWERLAESRLVSANTWETKAAMAVVDVIDRAPGQRVFTNAHIVSPYNSIAGWSKAEKVVNIVTAWQYHIDGITKRVVECKSLQEVFKYLTTLYGLGPFLAYEVCIDLMYGGVIPFSEDDWANAGPGAMRGANLIFPQRKDYLAIMRELRDTQADHFARLFLPWDEVAYEKRPQLSLRGIEHSLCEFQKYHRGYTGTGRPRNEFVITSKTPEWLDKLSK